MVWEQCVKIAEVTVSHNVVDAHSTAKRALEHADGYFQAGNNQRNLDSYDKRSNEISFRRKKAELFGALGYKKNEQRELAMINKLQQNH